MREARWFYRRSTQFFLALALVFVLMVALPDGFLRPLQTVLVTVTIPFQNIFSWTAFELREVGDFWSALGELKAENERLHRELIASQSDRAAVVSLREENADLRREVNLETLAARTSVTGEVIARDQNGLPTSVRLNRGSEQGVKPGMPVVSGGTVLVGRVISVGPFASEVRLLSHPESLVGARVEGVSGDTLVRGDHGIGLLLDMARPNEKLETGALVTTAGLGDGFPRGLLIGSIGAARLSGDQLFQQAVLVPPLRSDALRFMSVLTTF